MKMRKAYKEIIMSDQDFREFDPEDTNGTDISDEIIEEVTGKGTSDSSENNKHTFLESI